MSTKYFQPESIEKFKVLREMFGNVETLEGEKYVLKFRVLEGDVFVEHKTSSEGSHYNVQWFGKPESFGFMYKPHQDNLWGPYHLM